MLEFNLFLIDHWYYSVPLIASIFLWFFSESRRGGVRIEPHNLTTMVNKEDAMIVDLRSKEEFDSLIYDLTNFLVYVGEPVKATRERIGWYVVFYFLIFTALSLLLYREFHKDYNK